MRTVQLSTAVLTAAICALSSAKAADAPRLSLPAPAVAYASAAPFEGFYMGAFAGYGRGSTPSNLEISSGTLALFPGIIPTISQAGSNRVSWAGALAGIGGGYNFALGYNAVVGLEGDVAVAFMSGTATSGGIVPVFNGPFAFSQKTGIDWMSTLRARAGYVLADRAMVYVTGGAALAQLRHSSDFGDSFNEFEFYRQTTTKLGWVIGAGIEYSFAQNWSAKIEYLHAGFGGMGGMGTSLLADGSTAFVYHKLRNTSVDIGRIGVNYRFGGETPVIAKY